MCHREHRSQSGADAQELVHALRGMRRNRASSPRAQVGKTPPWTGADSTALNLEGTVPPTFVFVSAAIQFGGTDTSTTSDRPLSLFCLNAFAA